MITDELRKYARGYKPMVDHTLLEIADRIDAEHQKAEDEWKAEHGQMWLKGYSECHAELLEGNETLASDLEGCGWVRLPVDADGVPIHVGDVMETPRGDVFTVTGIMCELGKWTVGGWTPAYLRHHESTVEDVLEGFARAYDDIGGMPDEDELWRKLLAEYAVKLRLKEDE